MLACLAVGAASWVAPAAASAQANIQVELAFDMTSSMRASVEQAKVESRRIISEIRQLDAGATFSVVQFRDHGNTVGDYELLETFTGDLDEIEQAFRRLRVAGNGTIHNRAAESYTLAFRKSYSDEQTGWEPSARKLVVVFGDAEPYGAGSAGLAGCRDREKDPYGLNVTSELDAMRAAGRTLMMVRISSPSTTASAECYASIVRRANVGPDGGGSGGGGGQAGGGGTSSTPTPGSASFDLGKGVADARRIESTLGLVDLTVAIEPNVVRRAGPFGVSILVRNPNRFAIEVARLELLLPKGASYKPASLTGAGGREPDQGGRVLVWRDSMALRPGERRIMHLVLVAPRGTGERRLELRAEVGLPSGTASAVRNAGLGVVERVKRLQITASGRSRDRIDVSFRGTVSFGPQARPLARTEVTVRMQRGRRVVLTALAARIQSLGPATVIRMPIVLKKSLGLRGCAKGARGYALVRASKALDATDRTADSIRISVPGCKSVSRTWTAATASVVRVNIRAA